MSLTRRPGGMQTYTMIIPPSGASPRDRASHEGYEGYELLHVLNGSAELLRILGPQGGRAHLAVRAR